MGTESPRAKRRAIRRAVNDELAKQPPVPIASQFLATRRPVDLAARLAIRPPRKKGFQKP